MVLDATEAFRVPLLLALGVFVVLLASSAINHTRITDTVHFILRNLLDSIILYNFLLTGPGAWTSLRLHLNTHSSAIISDDILCPARISDNSIIDANLLRVGIEAFMYSAIVLPETC